MFNILYLWNYRPNCTVQKLTLLPSFRQMPGSNLGQETSYRIVTEAFCVFLSSPWIAERVWQGNLDLSPAESGFGGLEVACWPLVPKFAVSNPAEAVEFFQGEKIINTPSFGREVKPFVTCRKFSACKRTRKCMLGSSSFRSKLPAISRPSSSCRVSGGDIWRCK